MSHQQSEVQADAEFGIVLRQFYRFIETGFVDNQTRGGQNAFAMGADDGGVDGGGKAEVVGVDDETARHWVWSSGFSWSESRLKAELRTGCLKAGHSWAKLNQSRNESTNPKPARACAACSNARVAGRRHCSGSSPVFAAVANRRNP